MARLIYFVLHVLDIRYKSYSTITVVCTGWVAEWQMIMLFQACWQGPRYKYWFVRWDSRWDICRRDGTLVKSVYLLLLSCDSPVAHYTCPPVTTVTTCGSGHWTTNNNWFHSVASIEQFIEEVLTELSPPPAATTTTYNKTKCIQTTTWLFKWNWILKCCPSIYCYNF